MSDAAKSKQELLAEVAHLRRRLAELEAHHAQVQRLFQEARIALRDILDATSRGESVGPPRIPAVPAARPRAAEPPYSPPPLPPPPPKRLHVLSFLLVGLVGCLLLGTLFLQPPVPAPRSVGESVVTARVAPEADTDKSAASLVPETAEKPPEPQPEPTSLARIEDPGAAAPEPPAVEEEAPEEVFARCIQAAIQAMRALPCSFSRTFDIDKEEVTGWACYVYDMHDFAFDLASAENGSTGMKATVRGTLLEGSCTGKDKEALSGCTYSDDRLNNQYEIRLVYVLRDGVWRMVANTVLTSEFGLEYDVSEIGQGLADVWSVLKEG